MTVSVKHIGVCKDLMKHSIYHSKYLNKSPYHHLTGIKVGYNVTGRDYLKKNNYVSDLVQTEKAWVRFERNQICQFQTVMKNYIISYTVTENKFAFFCTVNVA